MAPSWHVTSPRPAGRSAALAVTVAPTVMVAVALALLALLGLLARLLAVAGLVGERVQTALGRGDRDDGVGGRVTHLVEGLGADVADVVARLVVALVVRQARGAAERLGLLLGLDPLGAGEQPTGRDADLDERTVVRASVEGGRRVRQALAVEVVGEDLLDLRRPGRPGVAVRAVAVVHEPDVVRRADHVEVEVRVDRVELVVGQRADVVLGAEQAQLFGSPEREAHGTLELAVDARGRQLAGDLEDA